MLDRSIRLKWSCRSRVDAGFTEGLCDLLHRAGCVMISFGVETFHPRVLKAMNKGISPQTGVRIIHTCADAGIGVKLTLMVGYPSETYDEAVYSQNVLTSLHDQLVRVNYNRFLLSANTPIANDPEGYGLKVCEFTEHDLFRYRADFRYMVGMTSHEMAKLEENLRKWEKTLPAFESEDHLLLYLARYGLAECRGLHYSGEELDEPNFVYAKSYQANLPE